MKWSLANCERHNRFNLRKELMIEIMSTKTYKPKELLIILLDEKDKVNIKLNINKQGCNIHF